MGLGIKFIGEMSLTPKPGPTAKEMENLKAVVDEAKKANMWVQIHAVSPQSMMAAVDAGVPKLVHTPHFGWLSEEDAKRVADAKVKQLSTIGFGVPVFGVFADDNKPRFRDGQPWPNAILDITDQLDAKLELIVQHRTQNATVNYAGICRGLAQTRAFYSPVRPDRGGAVEAYLALPNNDYCDLVIGVYGPPGELSADSAQLLS